MPILKNLVISGGGAHGIISFLGVIEYLNEKKLLDNVEHYVGTSAGSIISVLLLIGYKPKDIYNFCLYFNIEKLINDSNLDNFLENFGFQSSIKLSYVLKRLLENKKIKDSITFKELFNITNKKITITGVCLNNNSIYFFNHEKTPDMSILLSIRISSNIPIMFTPIDYDNKLWIDGGTILNYPIEVCHDEIDNTIGISFYNDISTCKDDIKDTFTYLSFLIKCIVFGNSKKTVEKYNKNTIKINYDESSLTEINIEKNKMINLYKNGYESAVNHFNILKGFIDENKIIKCKIFERLNYNSDDEDNISDVEDNLTFSDSSESH